MYSTNKHTNNKLFPIRHPHLTAVSLYSLASNESVGHFNGGCQGSRIPCPVTPASLHISLIHFVTHSESYNLSISRYPRKRRERVEICHRSFITFHNHLWYFASANERNHLWYTSTTTILQYWLLYVWTSTIYSDRHMTAWPASITDCYSNRHIVPG